MVSALTAAFVAYSLIVGYYAGTRPKGEWRYFSWHPFLMICGLVGCTGIASVTKKLGGYTNTKVRRNGFLPPSFPHRKWAFGYGNVVVVWAAGEDITRVVGRRTFPTNNFVCRCVSLVALCVGEFFTLLLAIFVFPCLFQIF